MIPVSEPDLSELERRYLLDAFDSGWISSRGAYIERAESLLEDVTGSPHVAVVNNGTTALHLALLAAGVGPGDEVILPSLTYVATINAVYYVGARPVVVDVEETTWNISPLAVRQAITDKTAAILAVDLYGQPADYSSLRTIADEHNLCLIADAAESIGATLHGVSTGSLADISTFSFFGNKVITAGEGGAIATSDPDKHAQILTLRNQGNHPTKRYHHDVVGYNYRMTNLSAAVLTGQLERIEDLIARRQAVVNAYHELLSEDRSIAMQAMHDGAIASPWMFTVRVLGSDSERRNAIVQSLSSIGIESRPVFQLVQKMPFVAECDRLLTPVAELISQEGISLPTFPSLDLARIPEVVDGLRSVLNSH